MIKRKGYTLLILLFIIAALLIGLLIAVPIWQTQIQREKEEELIFRGNQYIEAVRLFLLKNPGRFPQSLDELITEKCLRRLYRDPINKSGEWNVILLYPEASTRRGGIPQKILVAPESALFSIGNPQILGVVSSSTQKSIKTYLSQETHDRWLFYYGQNPNNLPEIIYYGQE